MGWNAVEMAKPGSDMGGRGGAGWAGGGTVKTVRRRYEERLLKNGAGWRFGEGGPLKPLEAVTTKEV